MVDIMVRSIGMNDGIAGSSQKGGILISLIITMVIFASLGVAMLSFTTTSTFSNLATYASTGASYLAESGYRYATGQYKNAGTEGAKNSTLESLHNKSLELLDNQGEFTLGIYPYYFKSTTARFVGNTSLEAAFPGSQPDGFTVPTSGTLAIFGAGGYEYYNYASVIESGGNFTFQLSGGGLQADLNQGTNILPVGYPSETKTVSNGDNTLTITNGSSIFPPRYGTFEVEGDTTNVYAYRDRDTNTLNGISVLGNPSKAFSFSVQQANTKIVMHTCVRIISTGTFAPGGSMATSTTFTRIAVLGFLPGGSSDNVDDSQGFTEQGDPDTFAENWNVEGNEASIKGGGPADHEPAINLKGKEIAISLNWQDSANIPDLDSIWSGANGLLDYELQVKIKIDAEGNKGDHYMLGQSFRYVDDNNYYGISFFRSIGRDDNQRPDWIDDLPSSFDILMDGSPSIALWKKVSGNYTLLDYKKLDASDGVIDGGNLKDWSTIIVKIDEQFSGAGGSRENHISGYIQGTASYPRNTINWNYADFNPVAWNTNTQPIVDSSITSENFGTNRPDEIGLHGYYDSNASNDQFFDDFSIKFAGSGGAGGGSIPGM